LDELLWWVPSWNELAFPEKSYTRKGVNVSLCFHSNHTTFENSGPWNTRCLNDDHEVEAYISHPYLLFFAIVFKYATESLGRSARWGEKAMGRRST
jgi:hypothetical protein